MKQKSTAAQAAASIKSELNAMFPHTKFSVKSEYFAGGSSVRISWEDGPTVDAVDSVGNKYQYGHFNGMEDMYEMSNVDNNIPQVKYVQTSRSISQQMKDGCLLYLKATLEGMQDLGMGDYYPNGQLWVEQLVHREISGMDLSEGNTAILMNWQERIDAMVQPKQNDATAEEPAAKNEEQSEQNNNTNIMDVKIQTPKNRRDLANNYMMRAAYYERMGQITKVEMIPADKKRNLIEEITSSIYMLKNSAKGIENVANDGGELTWNKLPNISSRVFACVKELEELKRVLNGEYDYDFPIGVEQYPIEIETEGK